MAARPSPRLPRPAAIAIPVCRGFAVAVALFAGVNGAREIASPGASVAWHLFQVPGSPRAADVCLSLLAALLLWSAFGPVRRRAAVAAVAAGLSGLGLLAAWNALGFHALLRAGVIATAWPVPLSAVLALGIALHAAGCLYPRHAAARREGGGAAPARRARWEGRAAAAAITAAAALGIAALGAVLHIHAFGLTDYRRPADAILVFGARAYADGTPSEALRERVETGAALYRAGLAPLLILSGGVGPNGVSEPRVMRAVAMAAGVPAEAIVEDELGVSTEASMSSLEVIAERRGIRRVLAVSNYFHLARIKLLAERRGLRCFTVPADEGETRLLGTPYYVLREAAALAFYFALG